MIKKMKTNEGIEYKKLSPEEMKARGILGRLVGICADFNNATRNGRKYSEKLWENVFNDPIMQEKIKNGVCFGELGHPEDRTEIDMEKIAVCLREQPVKNDNGQLCACFDILDTPNGRILKTLCDYGSTVGVSSRGQGDLITDANGNESVDPETYECECWDVVLVPAVESARMKYVTEGLDKNMLKMKKALCESLDSATEEEKKVMKETLNNLNINLNENKEDQVEEVVNEAKKNKKGSLHTTFPAGDPVQNMKDFNHDMGSDVGEGSGECCGESLEEEEADLKDITNIINKLIEINGPLDASIRSHINHIEAKGKKVTKALVDTEGYEYFKNLLSSPKFKDIKLESLNESNESEEEPETSELALSDEDVAKINEPFAETDAEFDKVPEVEGEEEKEERSDEEIFLHYLANNFDEKQIKKVCKVLDIEIEDEKPADEVEAEEKEELPADEAAKEDVDAVEGADINKEEAEEADEKIEEAIDDGAKELVRSLQEALKGKSDLENNIKSLQEKIAVSDTKVTELNEECDRYKKAVTRLSMLAKANKDLKENVSTLEESLKEKDTVIENQKSRIVRLVKSRKESFGEALSLNESVKTKDNEVAELKKQIETLNEQLKTKDNTISTKVDELTENLNKATSIKESYKKLANKAVNKYIEIKANMLGLTSNDIKRKLGESYTLEDVDQVCKDLKSYQLNISKLPFNIDRKVGIKVNEAVKKPLGSSKQLDDDDVDDSLIKLANI